MKKSVDEFFIYQKQIGTKRLKTLPPPPPQKHRKAILCKKLRIPLLCFKDRSQLCTGDYIHLLCEQVYQADALRQILRRAQ
jgi:hypothetical protein